MMKRLIFAATAVTAALSILAPGLAQSAYPEKPVRVIVTFPPGGSTDAVMRVIAPKLGERLGQQVIIDNRPGAGGNIGMAAVAQADPDGHVTGIGAAGALAANVSLLESMPFDPIKDLAPITLVAHIPFVLVAHPSVPAQTAQEFLAAARSRKVPFTLAHGGNGTAMHLSGELLKQMAGIDLTSVAYKGSGPAAIDAIGGQVDLAIVDLPSALQHIKSGKLRALAVTSARRLAMLPDVPTLDEAGVPGYESTGWFGFVAPAGTPEDVIQRLQNEMTAVLRDPEVIQRGEAMGVELAPTSARDFGDFIKSETEKWAKVITTAGMRPQPGGKTN